MRVFGCELLDGSALSNLAHDMVPVLCPLPCSLYLTSPSLRMQPHTLRTLAGTSRDS